MSTMTRIFSSAVLAAAAFAALADHSQAAEPQARFYRWHQQYHDAHPNAYLHGRREGIWGAPNDPNHGYTWHGNYYNAAVGAPVALVVPPTAFYQAHYSWGMPSSHTTLIPDQFHRANVSGVGGAGTQGPMLPTPYYPSSTDQFGTYYVRGPWW